VELGPRGGSQKENQNQAPVERKELAKEKGRKERVSEGQVGSTNVARRADIGRRLHHRRAICTGGRKNRKNKAHKYRRVAERDFYEKE